MGYEAVCVKYNGKALIAGNFSRKSNKKTNHFAINFFLVKII